MAYLAALEDEGAGAKVDVNVPHLRVSLPEGNASNAEALGPMSNVRIGAHRGRETAFVLVPLDPVKPPLIKEQQSGNDNGTKTLVSTNLADVQVVLG